MEAQIEPQEVQALNVDSPWKDILDVYFRLFLEFCYPTAASAIDWSKGYESLDKELNSITKDSEMGKRVADKLMKVWKIDGKEAWVLLHIEIQGQPQSNFSERMYVYNYRLFDRYHKPVVSIAILADNRQSWHPSSYQFSLWGCELHFAFISIKLLDYKSRRKELLENDNPFAIVILSHIEALETKNNHNDRFLSKLVLTRSLYDKGWDKASVLDLYKFIDWMMALPKALEIEYIQKVEHFEQERNMKYITSAERIGIEKGMQQGMQQGMLQGERTILLRMLQRKFGSLTHHYQQCIELANTDQLLGWVDVAIHAKTLSEVFENKN